MADYAVTKTGLGTVPHRLHDALKAAGVSITTVIGDGNDAATVVAPTSGLQTAITTVLATFDPTIETTGEQQADANKLTLNDLATTYQNLISGLVTIAAHMDTITAGPASPTAAQTGQALKLLSGDIKSMTVGLTKLLNVTAILVQRSND